MSIWLFATKDIELRITTPVWLSLWNPYGRSKTLTLKRDLRKLIVLLQSSSHRIVLTGYPLQNNLIGRSPLLCDFDQENAFDCRILVYGGFCSTELSGQKTRIHQHVRTSDSQWSMCWFNGSRSAVDACSCSCSAQSTGRFHSKVDLRRVFRSYLEIRLDEAMMFFGRIFHQRPNMSFYWNFPRCNGNSIWSFSKQLALFPIPWREVSTHYERLPSAAKWVKIALETESARSFIVDVDLESCRCVL